MKIQIETKFSFGDTVFFIEDDKIKFGVMYKMDITFEENEHRTYLFVRDPDGNLSAVREIKAFISREQLIQSL
jgi:extradiol dioxygenase family protein